MNVITRREKQVLNHISFGLTTSEIASALFVSVHTILTHRKNLFIKMDARNTAGLIRKGFEAGILSLNSTSVISV